jgi:glycosyltransferase involved in cell wall biosynthesis
MPRVSSNRPLRILHVTQHSEPGGLSRYIHDLALAMHRAGHDVRVAGNRGGWHWLFERAPFPYLELPLDHGPVGLWRAARALREHLRDHPVDVIHSHYRRTTAVARRLQSRGGPAAPPPLLYTIHLTDIPLTWRTRLWGDWGDHVHVASGESRRWAVEAAGIDPRRISLVPHGIQVDRWPVADDAARQAARARFGVGREDRVAVYVGRLDVPKNVDWLLDVADRSRDAVPHLKLLVAGAGPSEGDFLRGRRDRGLESRVVPVGELEDPLPVYQAADAMLLPSQREGFSLATAEAMSVGVPVCRTRTAGAAELIVEGVTGRSAPIDREAYVRAAVDFLRDGDALARMSRRAPEHVRQHFTFDRQLRDTLALYRRLAGLEQPAGGDHPAADTAAAASPAANAP